MPLDGPPTPEPTERPIAPEVMQFIESIFEQFGVEISPHDRNHTRTKRFAKIPRLNGMDAIVYEFKNGSYRLTIYWDISSERPPSLNSRISSTGEPSGDFDEVIELLKSITNILQGPPSA
jgi:hypothetical protein